MQIAETLNEGLKRAFSLTIPATEIEAMVDAEVKKVAPQVKMPGFRPGKVPANLIRKMHGAAMQQEALSNAIQGGVTKLITEHRLRPAMQPAVELDPGYAPGKDVAFTIALEVLPDVPAPAIDGIALERLTVEADDATLNEQLERLVAQQKRFEDAPEGHAAQTGDLVVMDFLGKVDGEPFDGGEGKGMSVEIGTGRLIPGFEDQLIGVQPGDEKTISVTFPADYNVDYLKGKAATFDLVIEAVRVAQATEADDDFAKSLGLESIDQLRQLLRGQIEQELNGLTRTHMKRKLLDQLADAHDFDVPPSMVDAEFAQIWQQLQQEATNEADPDAARAEMDVERDDYRRIAERRVRLGLLLSEIGQANGVEVSQTEMQRLVQQAAAQYDAKDRERFVQYLQNEPMAAAQLRAPLYEDKVVDFLFSKAAITDRATTRAELEAAIEAEDTGSSHAQGHVHGPDCGHDHAHDHSAHGDAVSDAATADAVAPETPAKKPARKPRAKATADAAVIEGTLVTEATGGEPAPSGGAVEEVVVDKPKRKPAAKKSATE